MRQGTGQARTKLRAAAFHALLILCAGMASVCAGQVVLDGFPTETVAMTPEIVEAGRQLYTERCSFCHGVAGAGDGAVADYLDPRPRDLTSGIYKFRTTGTGELPMDEDIFRVITRGVPGTAMPSWTEVLTEDERWQLVHYIKTFCEDFEYLTEEDYVEMRITVGAELASTAETVAKGEELYRNMKCWECHGDRGRGDGPASGTHTDDWGYPIWPFNLTQGWQYRGGSTAKDIYIRFTTGISGTPMPSYADNLSDEERWQLAHYIRTLIAEEAAPGSSVVLRSKSLKGDLPTDPSDPRWETAEPTEIALSGQVITRPRWQNPAIESINVRSLYNEDDIAFLLEWDDRREDRVRQVGEELSADDVEDTYVRLGSSRPQEAMRDAVALQFPVKMPEGPVKPHFYRGAPGKSVNLWMWAADRSGDAERDTSVEEMNATGYVDPPVPQPKESQQTHGAATWSEGKWQAVISRTLTTEDSAKDIQFVPGLFIPIAFNAWEGSNGERGLKMSMSSWYSLLLETSTPVSVYLYSLVGILLACGFELWLVRRLRKAGPA
jgi:DMSO reductase family type II enzyme heme b subunit